MTPKQLTPQFALTDGERVACARLFTHLETRIGILLRELEGVDRTEAQTAVLRGHIKAFRELQKLQHPREIQESPPGQ